MAYSQLPNILFQLRCSTISKRKQYFNFGFRIMKNAIKFLFSILIIACSMGLISCNFSGTDSAIDGEWLIPVVQVVDGGPGKDGIPSIDNPQFVPLNQAGYVGDNRLVAGIKIGDVVRAYPHQMMDRHEIANDKIGNTSFALTYCPLTGTGIGWNRHIITAG